MPHFVMGCSEDVLNTHTETYIIEQMYLTANATNLFDKNAIKVRLNPFKKYSVGNK